MTEGAAYDDRRVTAAPDLPQLLSTAKVAEIFGRDIRTIRRWVAAGKLTPVPFGVRSVFFHPDDIQEKIRSRLSAVIAVGRNAIVGAE